MDCSTPGLLVPHHLLEFAQVHVHWIGDGHNGRLILYYYPPQIISYIGTNL